MQELALASMVGEESEHSPTQSWSRFDVALAGKDDEPMQEMRRLQQINEDQGHDSKSTLKIMITVRLRSMVAEPDEIAHR